MFLLSCAINIIQFRKNNKIIKKFNSNKFDSVSIANDDGEGCETNRCSATVVLAAFG